MTIGPCPLVGAGCGVPRRVEFMKLILLKWILILAVNRPEAWEPTDRMVPPGWVGNPWGPAATQARASGELPEIVTTPWMRRWRDWGRQALRDGDIVFRRGDARLLFGYFPFSRFIAKASNSPFSHTGIVAIEDGTPVVYDISYHSVQRQRFEVWMLDNVGAVGVKRLRPKYRDRIPQVLAFCHRVFEQQVPFDYNLSLDDDALYCVEMTEKAFRSAGLPLSEPIKLGDMERAYEYPGAIFGLQYFSRWTLKQPLSLEQAVFFPGNERHGIWSSPKLETVFPPSLMADGPGPASAANVAHQPPADAKSQAKSRP